MYLIAKANDHIRVLLSFDYKHPTLPMAISLERTMRSILIFCLQINHNACTI